MSGTTATVARLEEAPSARAMLVYDPGGPGIVAQRRLEHVSANLGPNITETYALMAVDVTGASAIDDRRCRAGVRRALDDGLDALLGDSASLAAECAPERTFSSTDKAVLIERTRKDLGFERVSFLAVSYGARTALAYASLFPDTTGPLVLDGPVDPQMTWEQQVAMAGDRLATAAVMAADVCAEAAGRYWCRKENPLAGIAQKVMTDAAAVDRGHRQMGLVSLLLEWPSSRELLQAVVADKELTVLSDVGKARVGALDELAATTATRYAIECGELRRPPSVEAASTLLRHFVETQQWLTALALTHEVGCAGVAAEGPGMMPEPDPGVEALVLTSASDLVVSPATAEGVAERIHATVISRPGSLHGLFGVDRCVTENAVSFLLKQTTTSCKARPRRP